MFLAVGSDRRGRTVVPGVTFGTVFYSVFALATQGERFWTPKTLYFMVPLGLGIPKTRFLELLV